MPSRSKSEPESKWLNKSSNDFFDPNERQNILLGRNRYVYVSNFQGVKSLHIRRMGERRGGLAFTKEGVNLTNGEWLKINSMVTILENFLVSNLSLCNKKRL